ncbi:Ark- serine/threonine protein kinase [Coemansia sp. RSA 1804]|nr:Ark- serine/threonine protein kinase [Coemansia sp. RSA 1804]
MPSEFDSIGAALPTVDGLFTQGTVIQVDRYACIVQRFLASGGHANVYFVTLVSDGSRHVLKHIRFPDDDPGSPERQSAEHEIPIMSQLSGHPNIVSLTAAELGGDSAYILMEYCPGDVLSLLNDSLPGGLGEHTILQIFSDMCKAVAHMHYQNPPLLHRDLKIENILASGATYKLCDFGSTSTRMVAPNARLSRGEMVRLEEELQHNTTLDYRAPEMVDLYMRRGLSEKTDIWALGVMLYKLCYFRTPFEGSSSLAILNAEYSVPATPRYSKELRHIFQMTLREDPRERPTIYTLAAYVCALRGEPCLLENKYASPPTSPANNHDSVQSQTDAGFGYYADTQMQIQQHQQQRGNQQPRRYAASNKHALSTSSSQTDLSASEGVSDADSGAIIPMRRGRPTRQANRHMSAAPAAVSKPPGVSNNYSKHASAAPSRYGHTVAAPTKPGHSPGALGIYSPRDSNETTAADDDDDDDDREACVKSSRDPRHLRMSVKAPDGRESMSVDFVQGAVFGSARRTSSLLRRNPSAASYTSSHRSSTHGAGAANNGNSSGDLYYDRAASMLSRKSTSSLRLMRSNSRSSTSAGGGPPTDLAFDCAPVPSLPGFVCQPLPPPPPPSSASGQVKIADMISPLSLKDPQSPLGHHGVGAGVSSGTEEAAAAAAASIGSPMNPQAGGIDFDSVSQWVAMSHDDDSPRHDSHQALARLSTIAETQASDTVRHGGNNGMNTRAPVKSIYEMTMDKLEDDARFSMLFDDQTMFDAKARFAAQRSSVYQHPPQTAEPYAGAASGGGMSDEAQKNWNDLPFDLTGQAGSSANASANAPRDDAWTVQPRRRRNNPRADNAAAAAGGTAMGDGGSSHLDIDSVLQRAAARNRRTLVAQNNRRSQYIFGNTHASGIGGDNPPTSSMPLANTTTASSFFSPPQASNTADLPLSGTQGAEQVLRAEDVEDGMRVLAEDEIEELLTKMDMYNRELLTEQQRWYGNQHGGDDDDGPVDLQSLDRMIAEANDKMLREEQQQQKQQQKGGAGTGILQNVISAAKSTFTKTTTPKLDKVSSALDSGRRPAVAPASESAQAETAPATVAEDTAVATIATAKTETGLRVSPENGEPAHGNSSSMQAAEASKPDTPTRDEVGNGSSSILPDNVGGGVANTPPKAVTSGEGAKTAVAEKQNKATTAPKAGPPAGRNAQQQEATAAAGNPPSSPADNADGRSSSNNGSVPRPRAPEMTKTNTDVPSSPDPLAEVRARLKKKQSSPALATTSGRPPTSNSAAGAGGGLAARAAFLDKAGSHSSTPPPAAGRPGPRKQPKSVKNLVAMFEHS